MPDLDLLRSQAEEAITAASSTAELEELRVRYLGRKAALTETLRSIGELPPEERGPVGKAANQAKQAIEGLLERRSTELESGELERRLTEDRAVDEDITLADLQGVLLEFARAMFGPDRRVRLRSGFFPFTEPSVEVDIDCFKCGGRGFLADGGRCSLCPGSG